MDPTKPTSIKIFDKESKTEEFNIKFENGSIHTENNNNRSFQIKQPLNLKLNNTEDLVDVATLFNNALIKIENLNLTIGTLENSFNNAQVTINNLVIQNQGLSDQIVNLASQFQALIDNGDINIQSVVQNLIDNGDIKLNNIYYRPIYHSSRSFNLICF